MERTIISFDYAIKGILCDKANFDILSGFLTELLEKQVTVIPFTQNLDPKSNAPKDIHPEYFLILPRKFEDEDGRKRKNRDYVPKKPAKSKFDEWVYVLKNSTVKSDFTAAGIQEAGEKLNVLKMTPGQKAAYEADRQALAAQKTHLQTAELKGLKTGEAIGLEKDYFELRNHIINDKLFFYIRFFINWVMLLYFIGFSGCQSQSSSKSAPESVLSITIDTKKDKTSFPLSEITEKVEVIELETNDYSLINEEIQSVHVMEDHLIIYDGSPGVLVFDMQGNFVRRIGKRGQGPGEITHIMNVQSDSGKGSIWFWMLNKFVIYDINGNLVQDKERDKFPSFFEYFYYSNDSIFIIQVKEEKAQGMEFNVEFSYRISAYSNGNFSDNILDSLWIRKYEPWVPAIGFIKTIFQHQGQVYMFFSRCCDEEEDYLYVYKNNQFVPHARFLVKSTIRDLTVTARYIASIHGNLIWDKTKMPSVLTPDVLRANRSNNIRPERDFSYFVFDKKTGMHINSYHGFIDDIRHTNEIIPIKFIDGGEKFFYTQEGKWSDEINSELNPTLYIGTFKK